MMTIIENQDSLVFLPGWGYQASVWNTVAQSFQHRILLNLPEIHAGATMDTVVTALAENIPDNSIIVGWSLGGLIAMKLCHDYPEKCKKLIIVCASARFMADTDWHGMPQVQADLFYQSAIVDMIELCRNFVATVQYPDHKKQHRDYLQQHSCDLVEWRTELLAYLHVLYETDLRDTYRSLTLPILYVAAEADAIIMLCSAEQHRRAGVEFKIIKEAGHAVFLTHPQEVINSIKEFVL